MPDDMTFACTHCDHNIDISDVRNVNDVACPGCSRLYRVRYIDQESAWEILPIRGIEGEQGEPAERDEDHPFRVLRENAGMRKDDADKL